jgi:hypothetical protein
MLPTRPDARLQSHCLCVHVSRRRTEFLGPFGDLLMWTIMLSNPILTTFYDCTSKTTHMVSVFIIMTQICCSQLVVCPVDGTRTLNQHVHAYFTRAHTQVAGCQVTDVRVWPRRKNFNRFSVQQHKMDEQGGAETSTGVWRCRVCYESSPATELLCPCRCRGTMAYAHQHCMQLWYRTSRVGRAVVVACSCTCLQSRKCNICGYRYRLKRGSVHGIVYTLLRRCHAPPGASSMLIWTCLACTYGILATGMQVCAANTRCARHTVE